MTLRNAPPFWLILLALMGAAVAMADPVRAEVRDDDTVIYTVRKGDTLIQLARDYMLRETDWKEVQRLNRVADPYKLAIARRLALPIRLLKSRAASATVAAYRGQALAVVGGTPPRPVAMGQTLGEGARVSTGPASSLSLALTDGSVITLPSNSALRIGRLRRFLITDSIDYDLMLESGSVRSRVTPFRNPDDRFRLRNPIAVSAVRGTDFRTHFDKASDTARSELLEGGIGLTTATQSESPLLPAFGAVIGRGNAIAIEPLLPAPQVAEGAGAQRLPIVAFTIAPVPGAVGYKLQIGRDSSFVDVAEEITGTQPAFSLPSLPDGDYFARFTAIAGSGLEGLPGTIAFSRRLATATRGAAAGLNGYVFRWIGSGEGTQHYRFQLRREGEKEYLVDEAALTGSSIILSTLTPGRYVWRVGTTTHSAWGTETDWTAFESFSLDE
jgi:hypothetical protein